MKVLLAALLVVSLIPAGGEHPQILIDTGHGGYPLRDGKLEEFSDFAGEKGFSVDFKDIESVDLHHYCLVLIVNPDTEFSSKESYLLEKYLIEGGILFIGGSGDFENRDFSEVTNPLLERLSSSVRFNDDQVTDMVNSGKPYIPLFERWNPHPLTRSLPPISLYSPESVAPGKGYSLLQGNPTTRSDDTDTTGGSNEQGVVLTLLAVERIGKGDLLVAGSWNLLSGLAFQGHSEFVESFLQFTSRVTVSRFAECFKGASILTGDRCRPEVDKKGAEILSHIFREGVSEVSGVSEDISEYTVLIGGPDVNPYVKEINAFLPIQFGKNSIVRDSQTFTGQEYGLIAAISYEGHNYLVVAGLGGTATMGGVTLLEHLDKYSLVLSYNAYGEAVLFTVSGDVNANGVGEDSEYWEISIL